MSGVYLPEYEVIPGGFRYTMKAIMNSGVAYEVCLERMRRERHHEPNLLDVIDLRIDAEAHAALRQELLYHAHAVVIDKLLKLAAVVAYRNMPRFVYLPLSFLDALRHGGVPTWLQSQPKQITTSKK